MNYFGDQPARVLVAIGWLGAASNYSRGEVSRVFFEKLKLLVHHRFEPMAFAGVHQCELCQFDGPCAAGNLFVPDDNRIFVCPELVVHYIATHRYRPPTAFEEAVMRCPIPGGRDYRVEFLRAGGKFLLRRGGAC